LICSEVFRVIFGRFSAAARLRRSHVDVEAATQPGIAVAEGVCSPRWPEVRAVQLPQQWALRGTVQPPKLLMGCARLFRRVFDLDLEHCAKCDGELKSIAAILQPATEKILTPCRPVPRRACLLVAGAASDPSEAFRSTSRASPPTARAQVRSM
jgi:hypothetical protein